MWKQHIRRMLIGIALIGIVGCGIINAFSAEITSLLYSRPFYPTYTAQQLWENPLPLPDVIDEVTTHYTYRPNGESFYVDVNTFKLWEPVDEDVSFAVSTTVSVTIDGVAVSRRMISTGMLLIGITRYDENDNAIGSHGGPIRIYLEQLDLPDGLYVATVSFASNGGTWHSHQWAFRVES